MQHNMVLVFNIFLVAQCIVQFTISAPETAMQCFSDTVKKITLQHIKPFVFRAEMIR